MWKTLMAVFDEIYFLFGNANGIENDSPHKQTPPPTLSVSEMPTMEKCCWTVESNLCKLSRLHDKFLMFKWKIQNMDV